MELANTSEVQCLLYERSTKETMSNMQDAKQQCLFKDVQLDDTSPKGLGGNIHNEYLSRDEVVDQQWGLCCLSWRRRGKIK